MEKYLRVILRCVAILLACVTLGMCLLLAVNLLPATPLVGHVSESAAVFEKEGDYPALFDWCFSQLDNWTDATILKIAAYDGEESLMDRTLLAFRYNAEQDGEALTSSEGLIAYYSGDQDVTYLVNSYPRYWHGYLTVVKPFLSVMNYQSIRVLNTVLQNMLVLLICFVLWKKQHRQMIVPWLIAWGLLVPPAMGMSLQYSSVFYVMSLAVLYLLCTIHRWSSPYAPVYFFFVTGIATSYFDFLTYPLATLGVPMAIYFCLASSDNAWKDLKKVILFSVVWGCGYVGMWASKWVLASILTEENVILNAIETLKLRTSHTTGAAEEFSMVEMYVRHFKGFCKNPVMIAAVIYLGYRFLRIIRSKANLVYGAIVFGTIALMPIVWYFVASNHSFVHWWFTCKGLVITAFAGMCMVADGNKKTGMTL
jgi:hypothetical protein